MIEKLFGYAIEDNKAVEKIISDGNVDLNHMVFPKGGALPTHNSNSNVYMIVIRGTLTIKLGDQDPNKYGKGSILNIPYDTKMDVYNEDEEVMEMFVIKAPSPYNYPR
jgi:quercetin dioxygenase-like cupin family protein